MNDTEGGNLFPVRRRKHNRSSLTPKELAILHFAEVYGISTEAAARSILRLRGQKKAASAKKCQDPTLN
jgi:hypothetical protein